MSPWINEFVLRQTEVIDAFGNYLSNSQIEVSQRLFGIAVTQIPPLSRAVTINLQILET